MQSSMCKGHGWGWRTKRRVVRWKRRSEKNMVPEKAERELGVKPWKSLWAVLRSFSIYHKCYWRALNRGMTHVIWPLKKSFSLWKGEQIWGSKNNKTIVSRPDWELLVAQLQFWLCRDEGMDRFEIYLANKLSGRRWEIGQGQFQSFCLI